LRLQYLINCSSLSGLDNITGVGGLLGIYNNFTLANLCALYNVNLGNNALYIVNNTALSMDTANALKAQLIINGFTGAFDISNNNGSGLVTCDSDNDGVTDAADNCPDTCNTDQLDADSDGIGDVCDLDPRCGGNPQPACEQVCIVTPDTDGDGILDSADNCPNNCNTQQLDADGDGEGDVCQEGSKKFEKGCSDGCGSPKCEQEC
jgi:hypothetical protein